MIFFRGAVEIEAVFQLLTLMRIWEPTGAQQSVRAGAGLAAPIHLRLIWAMPLPGIPTFLLPLPLVLLPWLFLAIPGHSERPPFPLEGVIFSKEKEEKASLQLCVPRKMQVREGVGGCREHMGQQFHGISGKWSRVLALEPAQRDGKMRVGTAMNFSQRFCSGEKIQLGHGSRGRCPSPG